MYRTRSKGTELTVSIIRLGCHYASKHDVSRQSTAIPGRTQQARPSGTLRRGRQPENSWIGPPGFVGGVSLNPGPPVTGPGGFVVAVPRAAVYSRALSTAELRAVLDVERNRDLNSFLLSSPAELKPWNASTHVRRRPSWATWAVAD